MRIFVYEHITGGGFMNQPLPASLAHEGELMLQALVHDLMDIPGTEVLVMRDGRLSPLPAPVVNFTPDDDESAADLFLRCCKMSDAVWPIAPESGGMLEQLSRIAIDSGRALLGSRPAAIRTAGSKSATSAILASAGIPVLPAYRDFADLPEDLQQIVVKPDDGAGCVDTYLLGRDAACRWRSAHPGGNYILQPFVDGEALSLSMLCRDGQARLLSVNRQRVTIDKGTFRFTGVAVNEVPDPAKIYARLADAVAAAIPGLWGYAGIDFLATETGPLVVEVNPRLTTSYADLRRALHCNPAALVLGLLQSAPREEAIPLAMQSVAIEACHDG